MFIFVIAGPLSFKVLLHGGAIPAEEIDASVTKTDRVGQEHKSQKRATAREKRQGREQKRVFSPNFERVVETKKPFL